MVFYIKHNKHVQKRFRASGGKFISKNQVISEPVVETITGYESTTVSEPVVAEEDSIIIPQHEDELMLEDINSEFTSFAEL
ncbi:unnamed protein product [Cunninghamella blakesleeana]